MSRSITEKLKDFEIHISEIYDSLHNYYMCIPDVPDGGFIEGSFGDLQSAMDKLEDARRRIAKGEI